MPQALSLYELLGHTPGRRHCLNWLGTLTRKLPNGDEASRPYYVALRRLKGEVAAQARRDSAGGNTWVSRWCGSGISLQLQLPLMTAPRAGALPPPAHVAHATAHATAHAATLRRAATVGRGRGSPEVGRTARASKEVSRPAPVRSKARRHDAAARGSPPDRARLAAKVAGGEDRHGSASARRGAVGKGGE